MTQAASVYGEALYALAKEDGLSEAILSQMKTLDGCFKQEPDFLRLLGAPNLPKTERLAILDDCFRGKVEPYVLNFLKILTEKGYIREFSGCVSVFKTCYNRDNGILPVSAVTAVPMTDSQKDKLMDKLHQITGKQIELINDIDPACIGGVRLDYDGKCVDDTLSHRLDAMRRMLKNTIL